MLVEFGPELSFLMENHVNDNKIESLDFYECTLYMILVIFPKMAKPMLAISVKNPVSFIKIVPRDI